MPRTKKTQARRQRAAGASTFGRSLLHQRLMAHQLQQESYFAAVKSEKREDPHLLPALASFSSASPSSPAVAASFSSHEGRGIAVSAGSTRHHLLDFLSGRSMDAAFLEKQKRSHNLQSLTQQSELDFYLSTVLASQDQFLINKGEAQVWLKSEEESACLTAQPVYKATGAERSEKDDEEVAIPRRPFRFPVVWFAGAEDAERRTNEKGEREEDRRERRSELRMRCKRKKKNRQRVAVLLKGKMEEATIHNVEFVSAHRREQQIKWSKKKQREDDKKKKGKSKARLTAPGAKGPLADSELADEEEDLREEDMEEEDAEQEAEELGDEEKQEEDEEEGEEEEEEEEGEEEEGEEEEGEEEEEEEEQDEEKEQDGKGAEEEEESSFVSGCSVASKEPVEAAASNAIPSGGALPRTAAELEALERDAFLRWRRELAFLEEKQGVSLSPFERNLDVWRQLWRVVEKSHLLLQIVDGRDIRFFRSRDLEQFVKEVDSRKEVVLVVNKADLIPPSVRQKWAEALKKENVSHVFFSALKELTDQAREQEGERREQARTTPKEANDEQPEEEENAEEMEEGAGDKGKDSSGGGAYLGCWLDDEVENSPATSASSPPVLKTQDLLALLSLRRDQFLASFAAHKRREQAEKGSAEDSALLASPPPFIVGLVGFPNVGKSSVINALLGSKKVSVSRTPGKTRHLQTLVVGDTGLTLCDCPGLVFPRRVATKHHLVVNGVLPLDHMRGDFIPSIQLLCDRIPRQLLRLYGLPAAPPPPPLPPRLSKKLAGRQTEPRVSRGQVAGVLSPPELQLHAPAFLESLAQKRRFTAGGKGGQWDLYRVAKMVLKDHASGRVTACRGPDGRYYDGEQERRETEQTNAASFANGGPPDGDKATEGAAKAAQGAQIGDRDQGSEQREHTCEPAAEAMARPERGTTCDSEVQSGLSSSAPRERTLDDSGEEIKRMSHRLSAEAEAGKAFAAVASSRAPPPTQEKDLSEDIDPRLLQDLLDLTIDEDFAQIVGADKDVLALGEKPGHICREGNNGMTKRKMRHLQKQILKGRRPVS
ncbi:GTP-binding family protein [Toxoplasma gondii VAND]|uniref:GTP-binding family protein n=1 Tax=Toxoplasma gondii VAND TaxID=933077 RepID=A0A086PZ87_TOXGO|nr:GTP-binding family protein [Toxoplasma gondii VAND]